MFLQEKVPYNGEIEHLGLSTLGHFSTFVGAIRSNLFLPQRQAKKGYPLLSPILSATYHFSTFNYVFNKKHCTINHLHFLLGGKSFFLPKISCRKISGSHNKNPIYIRHRVPYNFVGSLWANYHFSTYCKSIYTI